VADYVAMKEVKCGEAEHLQNSQMAVKGEATRLEVKCKEKEQVTTDKEIKHLKAFLLCRRQHSTTRACSKKTAS